MKKQKEDLKDKKLRIVATIGTSSDKESILEAMIDSGLNVARMNMSHGDHAEHHKKIAALRKAAKKSRAKVAVLVDLAGPKIRTGEIEKDTVLKEGSTLILTTVPCMGTARRISVSYKKLPAEVKKGEHILVSDGKRVLEVLSTNRVDEIRCRVLVGGHVVSRRGINVPGAALSIAAITAKDKKDIQFAVDHAADYVALSFVRSAADVKSLRTLLSKAGSHARVVSKIETREAMANIDAIAEASDEVMVARGDLAMEIGIENVPVAQRRIIEAAGKFRKPVIVATQVLDSMERAPGPTRAEVSDIAAAVFGGASAVMLSGETAIGSYPVEAVATVSRVARACERSAYYRRG